MRKRRGLTSAALGLGGGLILGLLLLSLAPRVQQPSSPSLPLQQQQQQPRIDDGDEDDDQEGGLLFVGVMTASKYLGSRARAVYDSWGREVPGRIGFYSSEGSRSDLPLVALPRVDDSYPPQKKSFLMLEHMWRHFGERYEWFLRADDDLYVRMDRLERLLRSVDSRRPQYVGQAGRGNSEEFGLLSLEYDENFCMGGPGVLLSRETLRRLVPHIRYCLANLYTGHEDVELGRCVRRFAGISCTWNYEMQSILYHNSSGDLAFTGRLKSKEVHRAISLHPVKSPPHMYRLHNYMRGLRLQELQQTRLELRRELERGSEDHQERRAWDFFSRSEFSLADSNPRRRLHADLREGLEDATRQVMAEINACSRQRGRFVEERQALYGYRRRTSRGAETVLDLLLLYKKYRGRKVTLPVRRHLYLRQQYTGLETRELEETSDLETIHFVVPVFGRQEALRRFLVNYERDCLKPRERTQLLVVLYASIEQPEADASVGRLLERLQREYGEEKVHLVQGRGAFSRARALDQAASILDGDQLMFFVDVDIAFNGEALARIRRNTLRGRRVYFPVVFSQYDPRIVYGSEAPTVGTVSELSGFWRIFGFGIVSMYKCDYDEIGRFDLTIEGWGKEDVDLYEKAVRSGLQIFRAPDLNLVHVFHGIYCEKSLDGRQFSMCKGTRADTYASTKQLASLIYMNPEYLRYAKKRKATDNSSAAAA